MEWMRLEKSDVAIILELLYDYQQYVETYPDFFWQNAGRIISPNALKRYQAYHSTFRGYGALVRRALEGSLPPGFAVLRTHDGTALAWRTVGLPLMEGPTTEFQARLWCWRQAYLEQCYQDSDPEIVDPNGAVMEGKELMTPDEEYEQALQKYVSAVGEYALAQRRYKEAVGELAAQVKFNESLDRVSLAVEQAKGKYPKVFMPDEEIARRAMRAVAVVDADRGERADGQQKDEPTRRIISPGLMAEISRLMRELTQVLGRSWGCFVQVEALQTVLDLPGQETPACYFIREGRAEAVIEQYHVFDARIQRTDRARSETIKVFLPRK